MAARFSCLLLLLVLPTAACTEEPTPKEAETAAQNADVEDNAEAVREQKKSIEEAAEAAVKLIEEEARLEIEESGRAANIEASDPQPDSSGQ